MVDDSVSVIQINAGHSFATRCTKTIMSYYYVYFHFSWENAKGWERRWPKVQAGVPDSLSLPGGGDPLDWDPQFFPPLQPIQYIAARSAGPKIKFFGGGGDGGVLLTDGGLFYLVPTWERVRERENRA